MYLQIENEFKENSRIRSSQILFIVGAILFGIGNTFDAIVSLVA